VYDHEGDTQADRKAHGHGDELERGLEAGQVRRGLARVLLGREGQKPAVAEPAGQLEEDASDHDDESVS